MSSTYRCSTQLVLVMTTNSTSRSGYAGDIESRKHTQRKQFSKKSSPCPFIIYRGYTRHIPSAHFQFVDNETLSTLAIQDSPSAHFQFVHKETKPGNTQESCSVRWGIQLHVHLQSKKGQEGVPPPHPTAETSQTVNVCEFMPKT